MDIERAQAPPGKTVRCPPDRGEPGYIGKVTHVSQQVQIALNGTKYVWVTVAKRTAIHGSVVHPQSAVWPSNRLG